MLNSPWFGVAAQNNATVEGENGTPLTLPDALGAWVMGSPVEAIDTHPSSKAVCAQATADR